MQTEERGFNPRKVSGRRRAASQQNLHSPPGCDAVHESVVLVQQVDGCGRTPALTRPQVRLLACIVATCAGTSGTATWTRLPKPAERSAGKLARLQLIEQDPADGLHVTSTALGLAAVRELADGHAVCAEALALLSAEVFA